MALVCGYTVFLPGKWDTTTFFFSYTMVGLFPLMFIFWKMAAKSQVRYERSSRLRSHRLYSKWRALEDITFFEAERMKIDEYEAAMASPT